MLKSRKVTKLPFTQTELKSVFKYTEDGFLCWTGEPIDGKVHARRQKGDQAGFTYNGDYLVQYKNMQCSARDLVGFLQLGQWYRHEPLDGNKANLAWLNLVRKPEDELVEVKAIKPKKLAKRKSKRNTSGFSNVYYNRATDTWFGRIVLHGVHHGTSHFKTAQEAAEALVDLKKSIGTYVDQNAVKRAKIAEIIDSNESLTSLELADLILDL